MPYFTGIEKIRALYFSMRQDQASSLPDKHSFTRLTSSHISDGFLISLVAMHSVRETYSISRYCTCKSDVIRRTSAIFLRARWSAVQLGNQFAQHPFCER